MRVGGGMLIGTQARAKWGGGGGGPAPTADLCVCVYAAESLVSCRVHWPVR